MSTEALPGTQANCEVSGTIAGDKTAQLRLIKWTSASPCLDVEAVNLADDELVAAANLLHRGVGRAAANLLERAVGALPATGLSLPGCQSG
jgi:hypothetical protein